MKFLIAPDSFKGTLSASEVALIIHQNMERHYPGSEFVKLPLGDGGEGTLEALASELSAQWVTCQVSDPLGRPCEARYLRINDTAVLEMSQASGLNRLSEMERNPWTTSTFGTGQMLVHAIEGGAKDLYLGIGGSATNDGGTGMAEALGFAFLSDGGLISVKGASTLSQIRGIDDSRRHEKLEEVQIHVLCDVTNPLTGPNGATAVYGPQKGLKPEDLEIVERGMVDYQKVLTAYSGRAVGQVPGAGAAGGMGAALLGLCNAKLMSGIDAVLDLLKIDNLLKDVDLVITGEGSLDGQTQYGKVVTGLAKRCQKQEVPVVALAGSLNLEGSALHELGLDAALSTVQMPLSKVEIGLDAKGRLARSVDQMCRWLRVGRRLSSWMMIMLLSMALVLGLFGTGVAYAAQAQASTPATVVASTTTKQTITAKFSGGTRQVTVVWVNLNNPLMRIEAVPAQGMMGKTASVKDIVASASDAEGISVGGINGTFFNAYTDFQPMGTLITDGNMRHLNNTGSLFAIDQLNQVSIIRPKVYIEGSTQGDWVWPNRWTAWSINHFITDPKATLVFDKFYAGPKPKHGFTGISVDKGIVTNVGVGSWAIPTNGFLILTQDKNQIALLTKGKQVAYRMKYEDYNKNSMESYFSQVAQAVGAGPTVLLNGKVLNDAIYEGFTETKITQNRATRSLIGVRADGYVGMAVVSSVSTKELGEIAKSLGMVNAMNLDGGGSSALVYNNGYLSGPGRNVSNALVIKQLKERPVAVNLNGKAIHFAAQGYVDGSSKAVMLPLAPIASALSATVSLDPAKGIFSFVRYGLVIKGAVGSKELDVSGKKIPLPAPVTLRAGQVFVPMQFFSDGVLVKQQWDPSKFLLTMTIDTLETTLAKAKAAVAEKQLDAAVLHYQKVLEYNPNHVEALTVLASYYREVQKNIDQAAPYYEQLIKLNPGDFTYLNTLAWSYYSASRIEEALVQFTRFTGAYPKEAMAFYGQGLCYAHFKIKDVPKAKIAFNTAVDLGLKGDYLAFAQKYLAENK